MIAVLVGLLGVFFLFYTARLLVVTQALQHTRPGGQGAYVGAVVFPILAVAFGWASWRFWRAGARQRD
jgi:hypothetical protein